MGRRPACRAERARTAGRASRPPARGSCRPFAAPGWSRPAARAPRSATGWPTRTSPASTHSCATSPPRTSPTSTWPGPATWAPTTRTWSRLAAKNSCAAPRRGGRGGGPGRAPLAGVRRRTHPRRGLHPHRRVPQAALGAPGRRRSRRLLPRHLLRLRPQGPCGCSPPRDDERPASPRECSSGAWPARPSPPSPDPAG